ncbi:phosphatase PAP2 family protein [Serpentinicella sp. ANB-PHB4]|uniref:phosphatase PAP2 family protein n=1 Tax=Serpentinicella sp. ANB-PHB4 TaxID=3074076 RepID=UPI0028640D9D|nr:phosphatase PAP2 family protein [Serpentinicella sp. ANB-PHB4]MDR5659856.1 phosphatase PAP2 family protein [Serpentinicella sp. ANB-PHB4]
MKEKIAHIISVLTVVPIMALVAILVLHWNQPAFFGGGFWLVWTLFCLVLIPISAYGLKNQFDKFKNGREGERNFAFIMGVLGQVVGLIGAFVFNAPLGVRTFFMTYFIAGILLSSVNFLVKKKASGHACGVTGPLSFLAVVLNPKILLSLLMLPVVFWARLTLNRHTLSDLIIGSFIGITATIISVNIFL